GVPVLRLWDLEEPREVHEVRLVRAHRGDHLIAAPLPEQVAQTIARITTALTNLVEHGAGRNGNVTNIRGRYELGGDDFLLRLFLASSFRRGHPSSRLPGLGFHMGCVSVRKRSAALDRSRRSSSISL